MAALVFFGAGFGQAPDEDDEPANNGPAKNEVGHRNGGDSGGARSNESGQEVEQGHEQETEGGDGPGQGFSHRMEKVGHGSGEDEIGNEHDCHKGANQPLAPGRDRFGVLGLASGLGFHDCWNGGLSFLGGERGGRWSKKERMKSGKRLRRWRVGQVA